MLAHVADAPDRGLSGYTAVMTTNQRVQRAAAWLLACVAASGLAGCSNSTNDDSIQPITLTSVRDTQARGKETVVFIDARGPREFAERRIPGARNMQIDAVPEKHATIDPALEKFDLIVVYGRDPGSAAARGLAKRMINAGYGNIYWYMGGLDEWVRSGLPTEGTQATPQ